MVTPPSCAILRTLTPRAPSRFIAISIPGTNPGAPRGVSVKFYSHWDRQCASMDTMIENPDQHKIHVKNS